MTYTFQLCDELGPEITRDLHGNDGEAAVGQPSDEAAIDSVARDSSEPA